MKKRNISGIILVLILGSCGAEQEEKNNGQNQAEEEPIDATSQETISELVDSSGVIPNTDWEKENLNGIVKWISTHSQTIDEEGEPYGMGGSSESKEYNRKGSQTNASSSGCCGAYFTDIVYKYNNHNQLTHRIIKQSDDWVEDMADVEMYEKEKYFYNTDGLLVKMKVAGTDKVQTREHLYKFNTEGKMTEEMIIDFHQKDTNTVSYIREELKLTVKFKGPESDYKRVYFMDEKGLIQEEELHLEKGSIQQIKYTYTFDDKGNWTQRESIYRYILEDGEKEEWRNSLRETRTIKYFE